MPPSQDTPAAQPRPRSVSVLINNYNYGRFVGEAIESVLAQTRPVQVVVVDDGSTDDSRAIISSFGSRVEAVFQGNAGQGAAMNTGFARATGDVVVFLDADDKLAPNLAEVLLDEWQPSTVLAQYPLHIIDMAGERIGIYPDPPSLLSHGDVRGDLLATGGFGANVTSGLAFLRSALGNVMPLPAEDLKNAADGYLVRAVGFLGAVQRIETPLGSYRRHDSNDSNVNATPGGLADGFRKKIGYARQELEATRRFAAMHGLEMGQNLEDQSADYVGYRLFLLITDPAARAGSGEGRGQLLRKYVVARWASDWPLKRKALAVTLAAAATVSPPSQALLFLRWLHDPDTRPDWLRGLARRLRRT